MSGNGAGGCTGRGWGLSTVALAALTLAPAPTAAQEGVFRMDLRLGAVYAAPLAKGDVLLLPDQGTDNLQTVEIRPGIGPALDAGIRYGIAPTVDGEVRLGVSRSGLESEGPGGSWDGGDATAVSLTAGILWSLLPQVLVRGSLGKLFYSSSAPVFEGGAATGFLLAGGLGYLLPLELPVGLRIDGEVQWHSFGSPTLREAGAPDGDAYRVLLGLAVTLGGES